MTLNLHFTSGHRPLQCECMVLIIKGLMFERSLKIYVNDKRTLPSVRSCEPKGGHNLFKALEKMPSCDISEDCLDCSDADKTDAPSAQIAK